MNTQSIKFKVAAVAMLGLFVAAPALALTRDEAKVAKISGQAEYQKMGASDWAKLEIGMVLSEGDAVKTAPKSEVVMDLKGANKTAQITVRQSSKFVFKTFQHDSASQVDTTLLDISLGAVLVKAEKLVGSSKFEVKTPTSIVGIRGTTFEVQVAK